MANFSKLLAIGAALGLSANSAHAQVPAAPAILGLVNAGKTGVDSLQSFAVFREKITSDDPEKKIEPFFAAAIPAEAKGFGDLENWKTRKLKCEFHYADPGLGAIATAFSQADLTKKIFGSTGELWPAFAVSFFYTLSYDYDGRLKNGRGRYLTNVLIQRDFLRVTQGWKFSVNPGKYEASNAGTIAEPVPKVRTLLRFRVEDAFGSSSEVSQIFSFLGNGEAKREGSDLVRDKHVQTFCRSVKDADIEKDVENFKF